MAELSGRHLGDQLGARFDRVVAATVEAARLPAVLAGALVLLALDKVSAPGTDLWEAPGSDDPFVTYMDESSEGEFTWQ